MTIVQDQLAVAGTATGRRSTWALWGTAAGMSGLIANIVAQSSVTEDQRAGGFEAAFSSLERGPYHLAAMAGFAAVACLLMLAAGFRRWADEQPSRSLALRALPLALVASAGALVAAYGIKGQLASYLDGGFNEGAYPDSELYVYFLLDDLAGFTGWWGVAVAMGCLAWVAFRERLVPRWIGVVAGIALAAPVGFLLAFGFTGFSGVICPLALLVVATGLALRRG
ncbi:MAG: hypothetical protein JWM62_873 [Frankiales bacterium]|nr:hypothetical protein [Frankiales bacterium]